MRAPTPEEIRDAAVRNEIASAVKVVNRAHRHAAFDALGTRRALSPLGLVFFYIAADPMRPYGFKLFNVVRFAYVGAAFDDVTQLLPGITTVAQKNITQARKSKQRWDLRGPQGALVNAGDLTMPKNATFVGTALESLNTDQGDWFTVAESIANGSLGVARTRRVFDIPGQAFVRLTDGTAMHVLNDPHLSLGDTGVQSSAPLNPSFAYERLAPDLMSSGDQHTQNTWALLNKLHDTLAGYLLSSPT